MHLIRTHGNARRSLLKFLLLLAVFLCYFGYLWWKYDLVTGGLVAVLTWTFFVLCTPVADAGFLLDFPVRLITGLPMVLSELGVWTIAISTNIAALAFSPDAYGKSFLTSLLHKILIHPWPYWSIIALCAAGTFLSVWFGDALIDTIKGKKDKTGHPRLKLAATVGLFAVIAIIYYFLLRELGINLSDIQEGG